MISVSSEDKISISEMLKEDHDINIDIDRIPNEISFQRIQRFRGGDFVSNYFTLLNAVYVRTGRQRSWRVPTKDESIIIREVFYGLTPDIAYFPTFVFDFPKSIFLTDRGGRVDKFYRRVFQDILDYDGRGHSIANDIVRRVRREPMVRPWIEFLNIWGGQDDREKIQHVMDRAGAAVTRLVFGRWNKIFGEDTKGKEINISYEVVEGEKRREDGSRISTEEHDVKIKFQIRDGTRRFDVNDRSLGFRWFFCFMLFTQFRVARSDSSSGPLLFLFDEPASNLHAAAQQKLIESFPEIATGEHVLGYSTHSHYMIEPKWLEQTFFVTNRADDNLSSVLDEISLDDESLDIQVTRYRSFVNSHPNQTSYFQPILDRLEVVPSRFDMIKDSVVLEGKSDYYIIRYAIKLLKEEELPLIPGQGAGTFGALAAIIIGWNLNFLFILDGDKKGKREIERYSSEFGIQMDRLLTISDLTYGVVEIENLLDEEALNIIQKTMQLEKTPNKGQILRFFQERLASNDIQNMGSVFENSAKALLFEIREKLKASQ